MWSAAESFLFRTAGSRPFRRRQSRASRSGRKRRARAPAPLPRAAAAPPGGAATQSDGVPESQRNQVKSGKNRSTSIETITS